MQTEKTAMPYCNQKNSQCFTESAPVNRSTQYDDDVYKIDHYLAVNANNSIGFAVQLIVV